MNNKNLSEHRTFTQVRSDTLPKGEVGKGESGISPFQMSIQDQYKNTNIETLLKGLADLYDKLIIKPINEFYNDFYNLDTSKGIGLDLWGEHLNFPRTIKYINQEAKEEDSITLQDDEYRFILQIITLKLYIKMTVPGINKSLKELFSYYDVRAYTLDNQNMTYVNYIFLWDIPEYIKQAFNNYDLLPHPLAVGTKYSEAFYQIFGFKGQNLSDNLYRTILHKRGEK